MILPETDLEAATQKVDQLRGEFKRLNIMHQEQSMRQESVSLRVAAFPEHASNVKILIQTADKADYRAKSAGRDRVELAAVSQEVLITTMPQEQPPEVQGRRWLNG